MAAKRPSGPSGRHLQPQRVIRADAALWALVDAAIARAGGTQADWIRSTLERAAAAELKRKRA